MTSSVLSISYNIIIIKAALSRRAVFRRSGGLLKRRPDAPHFVTCASFTLMLKSMWKSQQLILIFVHSPGDLHQRRCFNPTLIS